MRSVLDNKCYHCNRKIIYNIYKAYDCNFCSKECRYNVLNKYDFSNDLVIIPKLKLSTKKYPTSTDLQNIKLDETIQIHNSLNHTLCKKINIIYDTIREMFTFEFSLNYNKSFSIV